MKQQDDKKRIGTLTLVIRVLIIIIFCVSVAIAIVKLAEADQKNQRNAQLEEELKQEESTS